MAETSSAPSIFNPSGANQLLKAAGRDDQSTLGPRGNRVQDGALALINRTSPLGQPTKANPAGSQTS